MRGEEGKKIPKKEMENITSKVVQIGLRLLMHFLYKFSLLFCLLTNKEYAIIKYMIMVIIDGFYGGVFYGVRGGRWVSLWRDLQGQTIITIS